MLPFFLYTKTIVTNLRNENHDKLLHQHHHTAIIVFKKAPCIQPHTDHDASPHEIEDGNHDEENVGEAPLVGLAGLVGAVGEHMGKAVEFQNFCSYCV
jgi:hypothetical protein